MRTHAGPFNKRLRIAVAGAGGFVGRSLVSALARDHRVRALGRTARATEAPVESRATDLFSLSSSVEALAGIDVAVYLVHSMLPSSRLFQGNFHDTDLLLADNFARACRTNGVRKIVYLGGLMPEGYISPHLASRREVELVLRAPGIPVTVLRAGMIVGPQGSSFEILRSLVRRLPFMVLPKWTRRRTQTIFIDDVVRVLERAVADPALSGKTIDVVNGESVTYEGILRKAAKVLGLRRWMVPVPVSSTGFSKLWVRVFGSASKELVSPLIDSLLCELPQMQPATSIKSLIKFTGFEQMVAETLRRDTRAPAPAPARRVAHQDSVRSIQRLPTMSLDCKQISNEYMQWVPRLFPWALSTILLSHSRGVEFRMRPFGQPLLVLEFVEETVSVDRVKFNIVGGLLSRTKSTGWLEFRQVADGRFTLASVNEFIPRLPWMIYLLTQAPLHAWVMWMFGRHLQRLETPESA